MDIDVILPYAPAIIRLLQGVVYSDDRATWECLIKYQSDVKEYLSGIGIEVFIHENDGFAFLRQKKVEEDQESILPNLIEKRQLSYPVTLLSVLLFERLIQFDLEGGDTTRLIIDKEGIKESVRIFLPETSNEAKIIDKVDSSINKLVDIGFLKRLSSDENKFEVRRILKAKISAEGLLDIKEKMREYAELTE